jgi:hypothetical protein
VDKRIFLGLVLSSWLFVASPGIAQASLVRIDKEGRVIWKVLSLQDNLALGVSKNSLEVKSTVAEDDLEADARIAVRREDGKVYLNEFDVTNWQESLVEIEERGETKKATIGVAGEQFVIEQGGITAVTDFPITIDPMANELSLTTPSGSIFLAVLPAEAVESALRSRFVNRLPEKKIFIKEEDIGVLAYTISGEKVVDIFGILEYKIPVTARVSASTGEILKVDGPEWFKIFGFLFT